MRRQSGFTLLEAIVAMVLISTAGLALYSWINSSLLTLHRVEDVNAQTEATANILEHMRLVNPMLTPEGTAELGAFRIRWAAKPITNTIDPNNSLFVLGLFRTRIVVDRAQQAPWFEFELQQVGYRRVRSMAAPT